MEPAAFLGRMQMVDLLQAYQQIQATKLLLIHLARPLRIDIKPALATFALVEAALEMELDRRIVADQQIL